jgi:hypothetical protein
MVMAGVSLPTPPWYVEIRDGVDVDAPRVLIALAMSFIPRTI